MADVYRCRYLTGRRLKVFLAIADCIIPPDEDSPGGGTMLTAGVVDWALDRLEPSLRSQLILLITVVEIMGIFFGGRPFSRNSQSAKLRQLKWMESGPVSLFRLGFFGLKSYTSMGYYTREDIWRTMDYEGPMLPDVPFADPVIRDLCQGRMEVEG
jgi:hypothetical protein